MPLQEGQILETEKNKFVLVRADKYSNELIAVDMDILSDILLPDAPESVIDITNITLEELSKTSAMELDTLNTTPYLSETEASPDLIDTIAKELIDDLTSTVSHNTSMMPKSCVLDISNFTAKEFFASKDFDLDTNFKDIISQEWKIVKLPLQVEEGRELIVFEPVTPSTSTEIAGVDSPKEKSPEIERRMPRFNKLTKLVSDLREFESQLQKISIVSVDDKRSISRTRKQSFQSLKVDSDTSFYDDGNSFGKSIKIKKARPVAIKRKKNKSTIIKKPSFVRLSPMKPSIVLNCETDDDENDFDKPKTPNNRSVRCFYCQKLFITAQGLSNHIKNCTKLNEKLDQMIEESCSVQNLEEKASPEKRELTSPVLEPLTQNTDFTVTTPVRKCPGRPKKKLCVSALESEPVRRSKRLCK